MGCFRAPVRATLVGALGVLAAGCADPAMANRPDAGSTAPLVAREAGRRSPDAGASARGFLSGTEDATSGDEPPRRGAPADSGGTDANPPRSVPDVTRPPKDARDSPGTDGGRDSGARDEAGTAPAECLPLGLELVTNDLKNPVYATAPPGDDRIFVLERVTGRIVIVAGTAVSAVPFLDVSGEMSPEGFESGLLGLAFAPDFATTGTFFVSYTTLKALRVARFQVRTGTPERADPASEAVVIEIPQVSHHNTSGMLLFGPDGYLYVATGDDDYEGVGQDLGSLKSKILRLDVAKDGPGYAVPATNPFIGVGNALPEIWAYGLREPYRFWLDPPGGDLYVSDVGENQREEVDVVLKAGGGRNFGWPILEGSLCHTPPSGCDRSGLTMPIEDYSHSVGSAIIGGSVYRGVKLSSCYRGRYFFGMYPEGAVRTLQWQGGVADVRTEPGIASPNFVSFGQDGHGEILVLGYDRSLHRLISRRE
jgi:glucose/arabinose dehydrogenase